MSSSLLDKVTSMIAITDIYLPSLTFNHLTFAEALGWMMDVTKLDNKFAQLFYVVVIFIFYTFIIVDFGKIEKVSLQHKLQAYNPYFSFVL